MELILEKLDAQWPVLARSPEARRALIRWANDDEVFAGMHDLHDVLRCRRNPHVANEVHRSLARRAATDELAGRTLLEHRDHIVVEERPTDVPLAALEPDEQALYQDLVQDRYGTAVRLEQERIRFSIVNEALGPWLGDTPDDM